MKKYLVILVALIATVAFAIDKLPLGNPKQDGDTVIQANDGGTIKDVLTIEGSTGDVKILAGQKLKVDTITDTNGLPPSFPSGLSAGSSTLTATGVYANTYSNKTDDGAPTFSHGVDVTGNITGVTNITASGTLNTLVANVNATTESTDKDTGALIVEGGIGAEKDISAGGVIRASNFNSSGGRLQGCSTTLEYQQSYTCTLPWGTTALFAVFWTGATAGSSGNNENWAGFARGGSWITPILAGSRTSTYITDPGIGGVTATTIGIVFLNSTTIIFYNNINATKSITMHVFGR